MDNFRIEMGIRMKQARKALHLTQEEMAEKLNLSVKHYGGVERGIAGFSLETLVEFCNLTNVSLDFIVKGDEMSKDFIPEKLKTLYLNYPPEKRAMIIQLLDLIEQLH